MVLGALFMLSATGVVIFRTDCICTGNESLSLYTKPQTCGETNGIHQTQCLIENLQGETAADECCFPFDSECGCATTEMTFLKLVNHLINDEIKYVKSLAAPVFIAKLNDFCIQFDESNSTKDETDYYSEPPPQINSTLDFLIQINQLKIPDIA